MMLFIMIVPLSACQLVDITEPASPNGNPSDSTVAASSTPETSPTGFLNTDPSSTPPRPTQIPFEISRDLAYIPGGDPKQKLDIYLPMSGNKPFLTLVLIHGGGRDKQDLAHWAQYFVERDYAVISINFRDMNRASYPAPVQDAFCALAWIHARAGTIGFDTGRIVVLGHSAGGTLAAMLGTVDDVSLFTEPCPGQMPETGWIQGVITFTGTFDYVSAVQYSPERSSPLAGYLGTSLDQDPTTWAEASAATWVDGSEPPFLLIHGLDDTTIEPDQSMNFASLLEQAEIDVELLLIPDADHDEIIRSVQSLEAVENFLARLAQEIAASVSPAGK